MSGDRFYLVQPQDSLFFRDGRPYEQADDGLAAAASLFPPHPSTLTGAMRAALALGNDWNGNTPWGADLKAVLGDGPDVTKATVRFDMPLMMQKINGRWRPLYPAPRHLLVRKVMQEKGQDGKVVEEFAMLRPAPRPVLTDLGQLHPMLAPKGWENAKDARPARDRWLTAEGLGLALNGDTLGEDFGNRHTVTSAKLWQKEPRIGLELSADSRTALRGRLYAPTHVRLCLDVGLGIAVSGLPADWGDPAPHVPLGGEHRFAHLERLDMPSPPSSVPDFARDGDGALLVSVTLLSPARVADAWLRPGALPDGSGEILSACLGDPLPIGGWDSRRDSAKRQNGPLPLRAFLPAGSCWFLRVPPEGLARLPSFLGDESDWAHGFGRIALGTYLFAGE